MTISDSAIARLQQVLHLVRADADVDELDETVRVVAKTTPRYTLHEALGRGGMGVVYRARDEVLRRDVALKVVERNADERHSLAGRLQREAEILAQLEHPGIVPVHDAGVLADGRRFYVMRLIDGERLDHFLTRGVSRGEALRLMLRLCDTVAFAHTRGVVHRDLKPGNIMLGPFGEAVVLDWGVAKVLTPRHGTEDESSTHHGIAVSNAAAIAVAQPGAVQPGAVQPGAVQPSEAELRAAESTAAGMVMGTPGYMSPEQQAGHSAGVNQTADVFALGVILRNCLQATSGPRARALDAIVAKATAAVPANRYATATRMADDLRRWLDGQSVSAYRERPVERALRTYRQHQAAILLVFTYLVVRTVILLWRHI